MLPEIYNAKPDYFVARVMGESMNRRIPNGSWCLFRRDPGGSREGKIVLVQHRDIQDSDMGGEFTVKRYHSEKVTDKGEGWVHRKIVLKPVSNLFSFVDIELAEDEGESLCVVGEFVAAI
ncbi:MAG: S24 family peptidase [Pseudohongiellaceae bacterium]